MNPPFKVNLFVNYYKSTNERRDAEHCECLNSNVENAQIDSVFLLMEPALPAPTVSIPAKLHRLDIDRRPQFADFFSLANTIVGPEDVTIIANTDIFFPDDTVQSAKSHLTHNQVYALSRWDAMPDNTKYYVLFDCGGSQDCWMFKGPIRKIGWAEFHLGVPQCDHRIAWEIQQAGYTISNPAKSLHTFHCHSTGTRTQENKNAVPKPGLWVPTSHIGEPPPENTPI